jgi:hypothetical protein
VDKDIELIILVLTWLSVRDREDCVRAQDLVDERGRLGSMKGLLYW